MQADAVAAAEPDCTRPWSEETSPWMLAARLHLDHVVDPSAIEQLRFNSINAPPDLAPPPSRSASEPASLEGLRQIVYEIAARARLGQPLPEALAGLVSLVEGAPAAPTKKASTALRIGVIGAGASGLTAAWNLERLGHHVTVIEASSEVAGKCASIDVDGHA